MCRLVQTLVQEREQARSEIELRQMNCVMKYYRSALSWKIPVKELAFLEHRLEMFRVLPARSPKSS